MTVGRTDSTQEDNEEERTKTLMNVLPRLIAKNQSDVPRMTAILGLPGMMKLEMYLDMRKSAVSSGAWYQSVQADISRHMIVSGMTFRANSSPRPTLFSSHQPFPL